jgi:hypothetical protein
MCNGKNNVTIEVHAQYFNEASSSTRILETQDATLRSKQEGPHRICSEQSAMQHIVKVHNSTEKSLNKRSHSTCTSATLLIDMVKQGA